MLLSVCLIARNEAHNLPRALKSVAGVAGEIIVTDTGSTDQTPEVAAGLGARVSHFPWCDDFSASRNFAVSQARGQWVLWLDADDRAERPQRGPADRLGGQHNHLHPDRL